MSQIELSIVTMLDKESKSCPVIVILVPPPLHPDFGDKFVKIGVKGAEYVKLTGDCAIASPFN